MKKMILVAIIICSSCILVAQPTFRRVDTTMKLGKAGYKVSCKNTNEEKNYVTINPVGFKNTARDLGFDIKGRIIKTEVDDLNGDGFPDLVMYVHQPGPKNAAAVIAISSIENESYEAIGFPDIVDDPKLRTGYQGKDQYFLMEGSLMRRFPLFTADSIPTPTGMYRQVQYKVMREERGQRFKVVRTYDYAKQ
jgi:hypothetical protein